VLTGRGSVAVRLNGKKEPTIQVDADKLYTLVSQNRARAGLLELRLTPGLAAYAFTFD